MRKAKEKVLIRWLSLMNIMEIVLNIRISRFTEPRIACNVVGKINCHILWAPWKPFSMCLSPIDISLGLFLNWFEYLCHWSVMIYDFLNVNYVRPLFSHGGCGLFVMLHKSLGWKKRCIIKFEFKFSQVVLTKIVGCQNWTATPLLIWLPYSFGCFVCDQNICNFMRFTSNLLRNFINSHFNEEKNTQHLI